MKKLLPILLLISCTVTKEIKDFNDCLFVTDYLILYSEQEIIEAENCFFQLGIDVEIQEGFYDDNSVFLIEVQNLTIYDYEIDGKLVFPDPQWYKENTIRFCIE